VVVPLNARHQTCSRILDRLQPTHRTFGDAVKRRVAVVQATQNERLDQRLYGLRLYALTDLASGELPVAGSSQCDTRQPPVQDPWPQQGIAKSVFPVLLEKVQFAQRRDSGSCIFFDCISLQELGPTENL